MSPIHTDQGLKVKVEDLVYAWADHFEELAAPSMNQSYDETFREEDESSIA